MGSNDHLARIFDDTARMLELLGEDRFRVNAYARAARAIRDQTTELVTLADDVAALRAIEGIGAKIADKIIEYARTGRIAAHEKLLVKVPRGLLELLRIPGLGPKTVKLLWEEKGVESLRDLRRIIEDESILDLPRMGRKMVENIASAIAFVERSSGRVPLGIAHPLARLIVERLSRLPATIRVEHAGSVRRGCETIGDVDVLVTTSDEEAAREAFTGMPEVTQVLASGGTRASVRATFEGTAIQADLRLVPESSFGAALMYFTGSKAHNVRMRERALRKGLTLNEYGLFPDDEEETPPQHRGVKPVASRTEEEIYSSLDLPFIPPELREDRGEFGADRKRIEGLVELGDIRAELHAHTTATDGLMSIDELVAHALERGCHTLAVTDHSQSSSVVGGLSPQRLREHAKAVREADARHKGITVLAGSEVDILPDGTLDYDDDLLAELDIVVASPHVSLRQSATEAMKRMMKVVTHPLVHIVGHPTGRQVGQREGLPLDIAELAAAAAEHGTALEINAHWRRLDLRDTQVHAAVEAGALIAINCDVHRVEHSANLLYGVMTARRGLLPRARCINTWSKKKLLSWLRREE